MVKQSTWYAVWTPEPADASKFASLSGDSSLDGKSFAGMNSGFNKDFDRVGSPAGRYWVTDEGTSYVLHVSSADKISHADYGKLKTAPATYYFTKTVQNYKQNYKDVDNWSISYAVNETPQVLDAPTWKAFYTETSTKTVPDYKWQASYKMTKTTTYEVPETPATPAKPTTPKHLSVAKTPAAVPQTGDSTNPAIPAAMAIAGAGLLAASRRKRSE